MEQLLQSNAWAVVATVGRRPVEVPATLQVLQLLLGSASLRPPHYGLFHEIAITEQGKLQQTVIDMDNLDVEGAPAFAGASTAFCTLGTQRGVCRAPCKSEHPTGYLLMGLQCMHEKPAISAAHALGHCISDLANWLDSQRNCGSYRCHT